MGSKIVLEAIAEGSPGRCRVRPTVVIADRGDAAWLVVLDPALRAEVGTRFQHRGLLWEISGGRSLERTFVAEPVGH